MDNTVKLPHDQDHPAMDVAAQMATLIAQVSAMETYMKRRFDELSMEINATSQQIDMSENGMAQRFGEILSAMNAISQPGDATSPANEGVELEAVITETQKAATTILDNCDHMATLLNLEGFVEDTAMREKLLQELRNGVQNIMLACSFQDLAGQRIRKTIANIHDIEDRISGALEGMGIGAETLHAAAEALGKETQSTHATQSEIDELFK